ncbi:MAG: hypothetical protein KJS92_07435 [Bacteroidetes bacterium]|nr:hypothetical protein [Bacteroidota bacterium]
MDLKEKEFIISVLNNKNYDYNQKIYMLQTDSLFSNHFFALERFRQILINTGQLLDIQESDLDFISIIATDTIIGTIPNINPCDAYRREVNACTRKMLDDWTSNFLNPLKMLLIAWEYNDCLKTADEKYPKCIVRHTIHKDLTQSKNKLEIGLSDPSIQN